MRRSWHSERPSELAREVGLGHLWNAMYGIDSALVHNGPDCIPLYVREPRPRQLDIGPLTDEIGSMRVLLDVATCMERLLDHFLRVFPSADGRDRLAELRSRMQALLSQCSL